jgi:hypothetical protein
MSEKRTGQRTLVLRCLFVDRMVNRGGTEMENKCLVGDRLRNGQKDLAKREGTHVDPKK